MHATPEEWRPITDADDYEVSNHGRVRSLPRLAGTSRPRRLPGRMLAPRPTPTGYLRVQIKDRDYYIHRLVLKAFIGPCPAAMEGCHNDGDRSNNRVENLRWDTRLGNCQDIIAHGTHANALKTRCPRGHEYDGIANGWKSKLTGQRKKRYCKTCRKLRHRKQQQKAA